MPHLWAIKIKKAINAAVEEDRKTRTHSFVGRTDRGCELCGEPDRDEIHIMSREHLKRWIDAAIEEERKTIAERAELRHAFGLAEWIRARSNASSASQEG